MTPVDLPLEIPKGHGFRKLQLLELRERPSLMDCLLVFEAPRRKGHTRYVLSADIADGIGQDRTSIDVIRLGTIEESAEQVAHFYSDSRTPTQAAYVLDALGHLYCDDDGYEALAAIETNNHRLSTQYTLQLHLGYTHVYRPGAVRAPAQGPRDHPRCAADRRTGEGLGLREPPPRPRSDAQGAGTRLGEGPRGGDCLRCLRPRPAPAAGGSARSHHRAVPAPDARPLQGRVAPHRRARGTRNGGEVACPATTSAAKCAATTPSTSPRARPRPRTAARR